MNAGSYIHGYSFFRPGMSASKQAQKLFSERERERESCSVHLIHVMWANPLRNKHVIFFRLSPSITHLTVSIVADLDLTGTGSKFGRCVLPSSGSPQRTRNDVNPKISQVWSDLKKVWAVPTAGAAAFRCCRAHAPEIAAPRSWQRSMPGPQGGCGCGSSYWGNNRLQ